MAKKPTQQTVVSRLPATRESRPALMGLAILLIVGGALASAYLALQSGHRSFYLQVNTEIGQGARITSDDLTRVSLPEDYANGVPTSEQDSVVGQYATTRLLKGTVLTRGMIRTSGGLANNEAQASVQVQNSALVAGLDAGTHLKLLIGTDEGNSEVSVELNQVNAPEGGGSITGGGGNMATLTVTFDSTCSGLISQGVQDNRITPTVVNGEGAAIAPCGS